MVPKDLNESPQHISMVFRENLHVTWPWQARYLFNIRIGNRNFSFQNLISMLPKDQNGSPQHVSKVFRKIPHVTWPLQPRYLFKFRIGNRNLLFQILISMVPNDPNESPQCISKVFRTKSTRYMVSATPLPIQNPTR